ncbi:MAG: hypothetical protein CMM57_09285 [Rhodospirillaceae bacterium]|nr:hypothetical protein [Rhodospirillaceae bacterium]|tara:strand:- start:938 stop:1225 length:288 start_codon:yes stop_codon:yes gene_type:complete
MQFLSGEWTFVVDHAFEFLHDSDWTKQKPNGHCTPPQGEKSVVFIGAIPGQPFEHECLREKVERKQTEKPENPDQGKSQCAESFHVVTIRDFNFG